MVRGSWPGSVPPPEVVMARWRPLCRDEAWMDVVRQTEAYVRDRTRSRWAAVWARVPPYGHWLRITSWPSSTGASCLLPEEEPLRSVTVANPVGFPPAPSGEAFRELLAAEGIRACTLLPLSLALPELSQRQLVGVISVGWASRGEHAAPGTSAEPVLSLLGHLLAQRVQDTFIEAAMDWIASQVPPSSGEEWLPLLQELAGWFGGVHWALSSVRRVREQVTAWKLVAENGSFPGVGAGWVDYANRSGQGVWDAPGVHSVFQRRIDFAGDFCAPSARSAELRAWQRQLADQGLRSLLSMPLGEDAEGHSGVLVVYWTEPFGWLKVSASARPWEALRRLMAGWWREMSTASRLMEDPLTGTLNRRGLNKVWADAREPGGTVGILDCDDFHRVNNVWGHLVGDEVLRTLGRLLWEECRARHGWCGRWGGDEFLVGLPLGEDWQWFGKALQIRLDAERRSRGWPTRVTMSGGAVVWAPPRPALEEVVLHADRALFQAKDGGGARFVVAPPLGDAQERSL